MLKKENLITPIRLEKRLPRILIDQDNVLAELIPEVIKRFNKTYGVNRSHEECIEWDLTNIFGPEIEDIFFEEGLFRDLKPVDGALEVFERLYKSGKYDIYIVTASEPFAYGEKVQWLQKHLPFFPIKNLIACHRKDAVWGDILLDDGAHNIKAFDGIGEPIVFDRPNNRSLEGYKRVYDWYEFEDYINMKFYGHNEKAENTIEKIS